MQPTLLAADADEYSVTRSLEAYLLWLFGYIMFNNTGGMYGDEEDERPTMGTIWIWRQVRSQQI